MFGNDARMGCGAQVRYYSALIWRETSIKLWPSSAQVFLALPEPGPGSYPVFWALLGVRRTPVIRKYTIKGQQKVANPPHAAGHMLGPVGQHVR